MATPERNIQRFLKYCMWASINRSSLERRKSDSRISQRVAWAKVVGTNVDLVLCKEKLGDSWFEGNRLVVRGK